MSFRDRLVHDAAEGTYHDGSMRYILIKPEAIMGLVKEMPEAQRPDVLAALCRAVQINGGASARAYRAAGAAEADALLAVICETASQLGWGRWSAELDGAAAILTVHGSPFAEGYGQAPFCVCAPITGMWTAVAGMVLQAEVIATETACVATGAAQCRFEARLSSES